MTTYLYKRNAIIRSNRYILIDNLVCQDGRVLMSDNTFMDYFEYLRMRRK